MQPGAFSRTAFAVPILFLTCLPAFAAAATASPEPLYLLGIPVDFILFALTLLGVALFHHYALQVALAGRAAFVVYKLGFTGFRFGGWHIAVAYVIGFFFMLAMIGWHPDASH